ncbi:MAG: tRNA pseudouridine(55) synthase TruB [Deltaproteobacteria bacterium]|nr:MAG: tRNA pseudouridine(55) synthase TruB [Deltaproteobacteria bacterium]RLC18050.1 MAG: tRNA pseudouridine(55) synthase TruB [Deltaproteobacteria bacterium]HHE74231.1 tRNA pseudouridine(55) synthase TruB [Desulfobacteraceae bacterium]
MSLDHHGFVVIDKPENMSSARVVSHVKRTLDAKKVGHAGTLDPFATGVMICCVNRATRLARFFLGGDKKYEALLHLGIETDTQDATGHIISEDRVPDCSESEIQAVFRSFTGPLQQMPPVYSALKHKGIPLYKHARRGKPIQKPARQIVVQALHITDIQLPYIRFEVTCSAGTYVRTLGADIGNALGCGGHLKTLRRTQSSGFAIADAMTLEVFEERAAAETFSRYAVGMTEALETMPGRTADKELKSKIVNGVPLTQKDVILGKSADKGNFIKIIDANRELLAVIEQNETLGEYHYCCVFN